MPIGALVYDTCQAEGVALKMATRCGAAPASVPLGLASSVAADGAGRLILHRGATRRRRRLEARDGVVAALRAA